EFAGELTLLKSIPSEINETNCDFEEDIRLIEKLLYDNSSPRPLEEFVFANSDAESESFSPSPILEFVFENSDTKIESFSPSPIPVEDGDSLMEEINLSFTLDYPMPSSIEDDDYDSERDILILKDLPCNDTLSLPKIESFHFDIPSFSRPPAKPPDGEKETLFVRGSQTNHRNKKQPNTLGLKMFFHIVLERNMQLHPRHFGRELREKLVSKLMKDVEGTCSGRHGFVVAITGIEDIGKDIIRDGTGFVTFPVKYLCVVFRPFKGEILEATVTMVNKRKKRRSPEEPGI
nr:DNA-directed RNA polymerase II subunit RPB7 [Tanacetum cinerariifolium]